MREAGSSFYWAMRLLDSEATSYVCRLRFCREVDDIADSRDPEPKNSKI